MPEKKVAKDLKRGHPTRYSDDVADAICGEIASTTRGLKYVCMRDDFPCERQVYVWLFKYPEFRIKYMKAKEAQAQLFAEETIDIASEKPFVTDKDGIVRMDSAHVSWLRMNVNLRQWHAAKLAPVVYGDGVHVEIMKKEDPALKRELMNIRKKIQAKEKSDY